MSLFYTKSAASATSPGPNPSATQGRGAFCSRNRLRMNSTVGLDMLPNFANTARDGASASAGSASDSSTAETIFGPPGWTAQLFTSASDSPLSPSHDSSHGRRCDAISPGTRRESVISNPWPPTVQLMSPRELGMRQEPEARRDHGSADPT